MVLSNIVRFQRNIVRFLTNIEFKAVYKSQKKENNRAHALNVRYG